MNTTERSSSLKSITSVSSNRSQRSSLCLGNSGLISHLLEQEEEEDLLYSDDELDQHEVPSVSGSGQIQQQQQSQCKIESDTSKRSRNIGLGSIVDELNGDFVQDQGRHEHHIDIETDQNLHLDISSPAKARTTINEKKNCTPQLESEHRRFNRKVDKVSIDME